MHMHKLWIFRSKNQRQVSNVYGPAFKSKGRTIKENNVTCSWDLSSSSLSISDCSCFNCIKIWKVTSLNNQKYKCVYIIWHIKNNHSQQLIQTCSLKSYVFSCFETLSSFLWSSAPSDILWLSELSLSPSTCCFLLYPRSLKQSRRR